MQLQNKLVTFLKSNDVDYNDAVLYLLSCRHGLNYRCNEDTFIFLSGSGIIELDLITDEVTVKCLYEGENTSGLSIEINLTDEEIDEYRGIFKGIRPGSIGSKSKVKELLYEFLIRNPKYDIQNIIFAASYYMSNLSDKSMAYNADNFISRLDKDGKVTSPLLITFDEMDLDNTRVL